LESTVIQLRILKELLVNVILKIPSIRIAQRSLKFVVDAVLTPIKKRRQDDLDEDKRAAAPAAAL
jgi:hypothetical protein